MRLKSRALAIFASACISATLQGCEQTETDATDTLSNQLSTATQENVAALDSNLTLIDYKAVTVIGRGLHRNELLAGLIAENSAVQTGTVTDRLVDINQQRTTTANLLSLLLVDTSYSAKFAPHPDGRARLLMLTLHSSAPQIVTAEETATELAKGNTLQVVESSEERIRELSEIISTGNPEEVSFAINQIDITPGGVDLLASLLSNGTPKDVQLEAMRRLDLADEYAAKGVVLSALKSPNTDVVLAAIESIEVWRDATVLPQINALVNHKDKRVRKQANELSNDLKGYLVTQPLGDPYDASYSGDHETVFPDAHNQEDEVFEFVPQP